MAELPEPLAGLVREHRLVEQLLQDARAAVDAATVRGVDDAVVQHAMDVLRDLDAFLAIDLTTHIAKEEEVLFPVMRRVIDENEAVVVDMLAQHDEIR
ncbi:MAG TPA: hemerythrin domain-containing protein, partial [Tepidiformaceae bacterium]|nr:hemerythrin domain-containing protein [Tepidiformaceae bacterium]